MIHRDGPTAKKNVQPEHRCEGSVRRRIVRGQCHRSSEQFERLIVIEIAGKVEPAKPQLLARCHGCDVDGRDRRAVWHCREHGHRDGRDWQSPGHKTMIVRCTYRSGRFEYEEEVEMPEGDRERNSADVLMKSAELIGWAIGGHRT